MDHFSLGPAAVLGQFENHWVYWVGPMHGAVIGVRNVRTLGCYDIISAGSVFYQIVLRARPASEAEPARPEARRGHEMSPEYQPSPEVTGPADVESQDR